jgi:hypothetical protein
LAGLGVPEDEARHYDEEVRAGRFIVTVRHDGRRSDAWSVLSRHGASYAPSTAPQGVGGI